MSGLAPAHPLHRPVPDRLAPAPVPEAWAPVPEAWAPVCRNVQLLASPWNPTIEAAVVDGLIADYASVFTRPLGSGSPYREGLISFVLSHGMNEDSAIAIVDRMFVAAEAQLGGFPGGPLRPQSARTLQRFFGYLLAWFARDNDLPRLVEDCRNPDSEIHGPARATRFDAADQARIQAAGYGLPRSDRDLGFLQTNALTFAQLFQWAYEGPDPFATFSAWLRGERHDVRLLDELRDDALGPLLGYQCGLSLVARPLPPMVVPSPAVHDGPTNAPRGQDPAEQLLPAPPSAVGREGQAGEDQPPAQAMLDPAQETSAEFGSRDVGDLSFDASEFLDMFSQPPQ